VPAITNKFERHLRNWFRRIDWEDDQRGKLVRIATARFELSTANSAVRIVD